MSDNKEALTIAREALQELIACKDLKVRMDTEELVHSQWFELSKEYERRKPIAWEVARKALAALDQAPSAAQPIGYLCFNDNWNLAPSRQRDLHPIADAEFVLACDLDPDHAYTQVTPLHAAQVAAPAQPNHSEDARGMVAAELLEIAEYFVSMGKMLNADLLRRAASMLEAPADHFAQVGNMVPQSIPESWKLVPIEPTLAQSLDGRKVKQYFDDGGKADIGQEIAHEVYRAMLAAAPAPADKDQP